MGPLDLDLITFMRYITCMIDNASRRHASQNIVPVGRQAVIATPCRAVVAMPSPCTMGIPTAVQHVIV